MAATEIFVPEFVPNQVLTDSQLNQLRDYLETQDHLTRLRLTGMGIICGLNYQVSKALDEIRISAGFGITSGGFIIELGATTYTYFHPYKDPDVEPQVEEEEETPRYKPWQKSGDLPGQVTIFELVDQNLPADKRPANARPLAELTPKIDASPRVLVLYLEREPVDTGSCLVMDCSKKGVRINFNVRALLLDKSALGPAKVSQKKFRPVRVARLGKDKLQAIADVAALNQAYRDLVQQEIAPLRKRIEDLFAEPEYRDFLPVRIDVVQPLNKLQAAITSGGQINQYHYDVLRDLADAYNEAAAAACQLITECCPAGDDFPRHLMLGLTNGESVEYRHSFRPSAVRNVMRGDLERVRKLFERIVAVADSFSSELTRQTDIRLAPSHTELQPVGARALPFYYDFGKMRELWQPALSCTNDELWSYYTAKDEQMRNAWLDRAYPYASFIRIEGGLGQPASSAANVITDQRGKGNAEFALLLSYLRSPDTDWTGRVAEVLQGEARLLEELRKLHKAVPDLLDPKLYGPENEEGKKLQAALEDLARIDQRLIESGARWAQTRNERQLYCNVAHLEADYFEVRDRLLCLLQQLFAVLEQVIGCAIKVWIRLSGSAEARALLLAEGMRSVAGERILAALIAARTANLPASDFGAEIFAWAGMHKEQPATGVPIALAATAEAARFEIQTFRDLYLPPTLRELDLCLLNLRQRRMAGSVARVILLCRAIEFLGAGLPVDWERSAPREFAPNLTGGTQLGPINAPPMVSWQEGARPSWLAQFQSAPPLPWPIAISECRDALEDLLRAISECVQASVAATAMEYEQARTRDLSLFRNLVKEVDGIEHRSGVEKGGTFILLCDVDKDGKRTVQADFSLRGAVPCSCHDEETPPPPLLPVAFTDCRVLLLPFNVEKHRTFTLEIRLLEDAYDPAFRWKQDQPEPPLKVLLVNREGAPAEKVETELGGVVTVAEKTLPGLVIYEMDSGRVRPGLIDRFAYRIQRAASELDNDTAEIFILFLPQPGAELGAVRATVVYSDNGAPADDAEVRILGTELVGTTNSGGVILFERVPSGSYQVQAFTASAQSDVAKIAVKPGDTSVAVLVVPREPKLGTISATVTYKAKPVEAIEVGLIGRKGLLKSEKTNSRGVAMFTEVPAGKYNLGAGPPDYLPETAEVELAGGGKEAVTLRLSKQGYQVPKRFIEKLAANKGIPVAAAEKLARDAYDERLAARYAVLAKVAKDPVIQEMPVYAAAENFLGGVLTSPDMNDARLAAAYKELANSFTAAVKKVQPEQKEALGELLSAATLGLMDRLSLSNPETLSAQAETLTRQLPRILKDAGVDSSKIVSQWNGEALARDLGLQTPEAIGQVLRTRTRK